MTPELFISWRYLITRRKEKFISLISVISIAGVAIGVMALIVVIAVMTGFDKDLREKIVGNYAHITVDALRPMSMEDYRAVNDALIKQDHVQATSPYILGQVVIEQDSRYMALAVKGIDPALEKNVSRVADYMIKGSLADLSDDTVIVGKELALSMGFKPGSRLQVYSPHGQKFGLSVAGVFSSGMYEYDLNLMLVNIATAQKLLKMSGQISAVAVKLDDMFAADRIKEKLVRAAGYEYRLRTWTETNQNFFAALALEKLTMFIILTLVILVASFNIISTLIVMVVEKTKDIGILRAMGMSSGSIRKIFTLQGLIIGGIGTGCGTAGGVVLCLALKKYQFIKLPQDVYYIDKLPVSLVLWPDLILVVGAALAITLAATAYPSWRAARLEPVEALRYE